MGFCRLFYKLVGVIFLTALLLGIVACQSIDRKASIDFSKSNVWYKFVQVQRNKAVVQIQPLDVAVAPPTALLLPLHISQAMGPGEASAASLAITRLVWNTWVKQEIFPILEYADSFAVYTTGQALALARAKGAEVLITGSIPYFIVGGPGGLNQISLHIEIYDVASGEMLWSISHGGLLQAKPQQDYIFFSQESKLPPDPLYAMVSAVAADIGVILRKWAHPEDMIYEGQDNATTERIQNAPAF